MNTDKKTKILVVDDDPVIRRLIRSIFANQDYTVNEADSGEMALEILPDIMPDIILLDIIMGDMDGFEVLKQIRADEKLRYVRIILLSSKSDINERLKGYGLGTDDYMIKPFVGNELIAKVNVFTRLKHSEETNISLKEIVEKEISKRLEQEKYIQTQEKLISMSNLIISIAHHWRQPLNALGVTIQDIYDAFIYNELTEEYLKNSVDVSMHHISFMSNVINNFQHLIKNDQSSVIDTTFISVFKDVLDSISEILKLSNIKCTINGIEYKKYIESATVDVSLNIDYYALQQAITMLILTSNDSIASHKAECSDDSYEGHIKIKVFNDDTKIMFSVHDNGNSISEEEVEHLFEPYYVLKSKGTSNERLGLFFVRMLAEKQLGGKVYAKYQDGVTTLFMEIPC